jgi:type III pantothenate kinase
VILDIDAGNTRIKWRIIDGHQVIDRGAQSTALNRQGVALDIPSLGSIERIRLSCVAGNDLAGNLRGQLGKEFDAQVEIAEVAHSAAGVICGYRDYQQLGVDRWLAMIAAYGKTTDAVIVVDAGSAVTIDIVGADGLHQGGYIVPGLRLMHRALWQGTDKIKVDANQAADIGSPGITTDEAVDKGCLLLLVSTIESLVNHHQSQLVITGGDGLLLQDNLSVNASYYPDLVLEGLAVEGVGLRVEH